MFISNNGSHQAPRVMPRGIEPPENNSGELANETRSIYDSPGARCEIQEGAPAASTAPRWLCLGARWHNDNASTCANAKITKLIIRAQELPIADETVTLYVFSAGRAAQSSQHILFELDCQSRRSRYYPHILFGVNGPDKDLKESVGICLQVIGGCQHLSPSVMLRPRARGRSITSNLCNTR